jgi:hypothetical protein
MGRSQGCYGEYDSFHMGMLSADGIIAADYNGLLLPQGIQRHIRNWAVVLSSPALEERSTRVSILEGGMWKLTLTIFQNRWHYSNNDRVWIESGFIKLVNSLIFC